MQKLQPRDVCGCGTLETNPQRVSDLLCMSNLAHASKLKEHDNDDDFQGSFRRAAERR